MEKENINSIIDVLSLTEADLSELTYEEVSGTAGDVSTTETRVEKKLPLRDRKLLLHVLWWRDMLASTCSDGNATADDWLVKDSKRGTCICPSGNRLTDGGLSGYVTYWVIFYITCYTLHTQTQSLK